MGRRQWDIAVHRRCLQRLPDLAGAAPSIADDTNTNVRITSGSTGAVGLAAATTNINTLLVNDTTPRTIAIGAGNTLQMGTVGGILVPAGTGAVTIGNASAPGTISAGGATANTAGELVLINNSTSDMTINSTIANHGTGAVTLTKSGPGKAVLAGVNTFSGATYVNQGILAVTGAGVLGTGAGDINIATAQALSPAAEVAIDSPLALISAATIRAGQNGGGTLTQSAGTVKASTTIEIGSTATAAGTYTLSGGQMSVGGLTNGFTEVAGSLIVGNAGRGALNLSGGEVNIYSDGDLTLASSQGGSGTITQSGGAVNIAGAGTLLVGDQGPGTYTQTAGQVNVGGYVRLGSDGGTGVYNLNGGTLTTSGLGSGNAGLPADGSALSFAGGTLKAGGTFDSNSVIKLNAGGGGTIDTNGKTVGLYGKVTDGASGGGLTKIGAGTLNMGGASTYTGGTTISAGKVVASGTGLGAGIVNVGPSGVLSLQDTQSGLRGDYTIGSYTAAAFASPDTVKSYFDATTLYTAATTDRGLTTLDLEDTGTYPMPFQTGAADFQARYSGRFNAPATGAYTFGLTNDDYTSLWIDGVAVVNTTYAGGLKTGTIGLTLGPHDILVAFQQTGGGYYLRLDVAGPGLAYQRMPNSMLEYDAGNNATVTALAGSGSVTLGSKTLTISDGAGAGLLRRHLRHRRPGENRHGHADPQRRQHL